MKKLFMFSLAIYSIIVCNGQNIGIGTASPAYKLDLAGRMRIQNSAATAGIYFDGTSLPIRSFIGTLNDSHVGIWGGGGAGWNFVMNTDNGNVGIGTTAPAAKLDINGTLRIRQNGATAGSSLNAVDAQGNAEWFAPVAFSVRGYSAAAAYIIFPSSAWTDINFGSNIAYNYGNGYNPATSEFVAPQHGLYNLKSNLQFSSDNTYVEQRMRLRRNGIVSTISSVFTRMFDSPIGGCPSFMDTEAVLEAGDAVWIEAYGIEHNNAQVYVHGWGIHTWFCGRLVIPF